MHFAVVGTDLKPLCTRHLQPMIRVDLYSKNEDTDTLSSVGGYCCAIDKCGLFYDVYNGYHERPGGTVNALDIQYFCRDHGLAMYASSHALKGAVKHFKCPQYGCTQGESVHTATA